AVFHSPSFRPLPRAPWLAVCGGLVDASTVHSFPTRRSSDLGSWLPKVNLMSSAMNDIASSNCPESTRRMNFSTCDRAADVSVMRCNPHIDGIGNGGPIDYRRVWRRIHRLLVNEPGRSGES